MSFIAVPTQISYISCRQNRWSGRNLPHDDSSSGWRPSYPPQVSDTGAAITPDQKHPRLLLTIVRENFSTQYASQTTGLASFRDAASVHGTDSDTTLLQDFRSHVPFSDYESYLPFMARFNQHPCKESEVMNLFAPGLPNYIAYSSATSGKGPKLFAKYQSGALGPSLNNQASYQGSVASIYHYGYREIKEVERHGEPNQIIKEIPVCHGSNGVIREAQGWNIYDDEKRMPLTLPGSVAPWAASMINHHRTFLMIHALFTLACRDVNLITTTFSTLFYDLLRYLDEEWDLFLSCITEGTVPALAGTDRVLSYLQPHLRANPQRAAELREIGPPLSCVGWAARVWPKLRMTIFVCSGTFATVLPEIKSILGPTIRILNPGIGASESVIGGSYAGNPDIFILQSQDIVEFLDVTSEESHENVCHAYDVEVGRQYEIILTTNDGLWRYRLGDVIDIVGFDENDGSPVFRYFGRRSAGIRFPHTLISDTQLLAAVQAVDSDIIQVHEFITMLDDRYSPSTVSFLIEIVGEVGPKSNLTAQSLFDGLAATNVEHQGALKEGRIRLPTVRTLKSGTFMEYRQWMSLKNNTGSAAQIKVPVVMPNEAVREWFLERVVQEL